MKWLNKIYRRLKYFNGNLESTRVLAKENGIERRRYARIIVPILPYYKAMQFSRFEQNLSTVNLSVGGVCLRDRHNLLGQDIGSICALQHTCGPSRDLIEVKLVGVSRDINKHLEFKKVPERSLKAIAHLVHMGSQGQQFYLVTEPTSEEISLEAEEFWLGETRDNLVVHLDQDFIADLYLDGHKYEFKAQHPVQVTTTSGVSRVILPAEAFALLVFFENFRESSKTIEKLKDLLKEEQSVFTNQGIGA